MVTTSAQRLVQVQFEEWIKNCMVSLSSEQSLLWNKDVMPSSIGDSSSSSSSVCDELQKKAAQYILTLLLQGDTDHVRQQLSLLIQKLQPLFVANNSNNDKLYSGAIHILYGCLQSIANSAMDVGNAIMDNEFQTTLANFLLLCCSYTTIQDISMKCLATLMSCRVRDGATTSSIIQRLNFAKLGVEHYISTTTTSDEEEFDLKMTRLIRVQRSNCIALLQTTLNGVTLDIPSVPNLASKDLQQSMVEYTNFICSCLCDETDPRCLLDFFRLVTSCQRIFQSSCWNSFPAATVLDAVAPYYPIRFTPPSNDPHGITRTDLRTALKSILCFPTATIIKPNENNEYQEENDQNNNMPALAFSLFMEQLSVDEAEDEEEERSNVLLVMEAFDDLKSVVFHAHSTTPLLTLSAIMTETMVEELSNGLFLLFSHYMKTPNKDPYSNKEHPVVQECLGFASDVSNVIAQDSVLWNAFTSNLSTAITKITTTPEAMESKVSVIYACSIISTSSGNLSSTFMDQFLFPLVEIVQTYSMQIVHVSSPANEQDERVVASLYAISAFLSAYGKKDTTDNDCFLFAQDYQGNFQRILLDLCKRTVRSSAVSALECLVLCSSPTNSNTTITFSFLCETLQFLVDCVDKTTTANNVTSNASNDNAWGTSCAHAVGSIIGSIYAALEEEPSLTMSVAKNNLQKAILLLRSNKKDDFPSFCASIDAVLNILLQSVCSTASNNTRYDWMALSRASIWSQHLANTAVKRLISDILSDLASKTSLSSSAAAEALGHLARNGNDHIFASWRNYGTHEGLARDIVLAALPLKVKNNTEQTTTEDEETEAKQRAQVSLRAISFLIPCYELLCDDKQFSQDLAGIVLNNLPPSSVWNECRIKVVLPILAAIVCSNNNKNQMSIFRRDKTLSLRLCAFALEKTRAATTRSLAVSCLFKIIASPIASDLPTLSQILFQDSISPAILEEFQMSCQSEEQPSLSYFQNAVCVAAIVGAASGCRGGDSGFVADNVVTFLLNLCCQGKVDPPFTDARIHSNEEVSNKELSIIGGMAFGNMLTVQGGSPFWKQRAASLALPDLLDTIHASHPRITRHGESSFLLGCLIALSHFVCCIAPLPALGDDEKMEGIVNAILSGLSIYIAIPTDSTSLETNGVASFLTVGLSALLKLLCDKSMAFWTRMSLEVKYTILNVLLKTIVPPRQEELNSASGQVFSSSVAELLVDEHVPRQLVAIECLLQVLVQCPSCAKDVKTRSAVLSKLAVALDSPSYAIRKASGRARNLWSLTDG